jgi:hypothetical protein
VLSSFETSVLTRATRRNIPEPTILVTLKLVKPILGNLNLSFQDVSFSRIRRFFFQDTTETMGRGSTVVSTPQHTSAHHNQLRLSCCVGAVLGTQVSGCRTGATGEDSVRRNVLAPRLQHAEPEDNIKEGVLAQDCVQWRIANPGASGQPIVPLPPIRKCPRGILSLAFSHIARPVWGRWPHCYPPGQGGVTIATNYFTRR